MALDTHVEALAKDAIIKEQIRTHAGNGLNKQQYQAATNQRDPAGRRKLSTEQWHFRWSEQNLEETYDNLRAELPDQAAYDAKVKSEVGSLNEDKKLLFYLGIAKEGVAPSSPSADLQPVLQKAQVVKILEEAVKMEDADAVEAVVRSMGVNPRVLENLDYFHTEGGGKSAILEYGMKIAQAQANLTITELKNKKKLQKELGSAIDNADAYAVAAVEALKVR